MVAPGKKFSSMDRDHAERIVSMCLAHTAKLDQSLATVLGAISEEDFNEYRKTVSWLMATMVLDVLNPIFEVYPDLKPEGIR